MRIELDEKTKRRNACEAAGQAVDLQEATNDPRICVAEYGLVIIQWFCFYSRGETCLRPPATAWR
ncbi:MAG: hypothetical protein HY695_37955 [Deltaproteobacteria bacterium]|nr:hypothetical protein [Deltaproteobacteria bacterium]